jgi:uncharacterized repeat protein (TIGR03803 family)
VAGEIVRLHSRAISIHLLQKEVTLMHRHKFADISRMALLIILLSLTMASSAWAAEYKVLYKFKGSGSQDGSHPYAGLIFDATGNLYGTTTDGGLRVCIYGNTCGTVFKLAPNPDGSWTERVLYLFHGADGAWPFAGVVLDAAGSLYGTTRQGGFCYNGAGCGTVFKLTPNSDGSWSESVLYNFQGAPDAEIPDAGLVFDSAGNLYGTTEGGGTYGYGTVFKLAPNPDGSWSESVLYSFQGPAGDGFWPWAGLVFDASGNLYGTTERTDAYHSGGVFKLAPNPDGSWTKSELYSFEEGTGECWPYGNVILDAAGNLYGTTAGDFYEPSYSSGTVFKLTPKPDGSWKRTKLHVFRGADGAAPYAGLIFDGAGNLYGTTSAGGAHDSGTVFKLILKPDGHWRLTTFHVFKNNHHPLAGLVMDAVGNLYGTTSEGGEHNKGLVFRITP